MAKWYIRILPLLALIGPILMTLVQHKSDLRTGLMQLIASYTGYDINNQRFDPAALSTGLLPLIVAIVISMVWAKAGLNRYIPGKGFGL